MNSWEEAVRERPEIASRFGPPAQLVAERLRKPAAECSLAEIMAMVARLREEYGLGHPTPMYDPRHVPRNVPTPVPTQAVPTPHVPTQDVPIPHARDAPIPHVPTPCQTCGLRPREGRYLDCAACRKRRQRTGAPVK